MKQKTIICLRGKEDTDGDDDTYHSIYAKKNAEAVCEIIDSLNLPYFSGVASCNEGKFIPVED